VQRNADGRLEMKHVTKVARAKDEFTEALIEWARRQEGRGLTLEDVQAILLDAVSVSICGYEVETVAEMARMARSGRYGFVVAKGKRE
jgi:hypothetical protein